MFIKVDLPEPETPVTQTKVPKGMLTSIFFNKSNLTIRIFPNPVINELTIYNIDKNSLISIYDLNGQLLIIKIAKSITEKIDVSSLASGIYFIKIINENTINTSKLIKQ